MSTPRYETSWAAATADDPTTLVLLHGTGDTAQSFLRVGRTVRPTAAALSVQGNVDENGMARFFRRLAMGVYDLDDLARRTADLAAFLEAALAERGRDPGHAIGLGYSNGANILANVLVTRPGLIRRAVLMHPLIPFALPQADLGGHEVLVTAGRSDPICPWPLTEALVESLRERGASVHLVDHPGGHETTPAEWRAAAAFAA